MNKIRDEQLKRELSFEQYGRYALIRDIIRPNRKNNGKFKVLDVGGRGNMMRKFLPGDDVFYLDPFVDAKDDNFIEGDGCKIPLRDESFDWVVSADVFEHISKDKRNDFVDENIRVAKLGVILAAPFNSPETVQAEKNVNESYRIVTGGEDHPWIQEHLENGLPNEKALEDHLALKKLIFQKIYHNWLSLWQTSIGLGLVVAGSSDREILSRLEEYNHYYNSKVYPFDFSETESEPSYRRVYFIKKKEYLNGLKNEKKSLSREKFSEATGELLNLAVEIYKKGELKNREVGVLAERIREKEEELKKKADSCKYEIAEATVYYQKLLKEEKEKCKQKEKEIRQMEKEIRDMKASKFWKMRKKYMNIKNKLGVE